MDCSFFLHGEQSRRRGGLRGNFSCILRRDRDVGQIRTRKLRELERVALVLNNNRSV